MSPKLYASLWVWLGYKSIVLLLVNHLKSVNAYKFCKMNSILLSSWEAVIPQLMVAAVGELWFKWVCINVTAVSQVQVSMCEAIYS